MSEQPPTKPNVSPSHRTKEQLIQAIQNEVNESERDILRRYLVHQMSLNDALTASNETIIHGLSLEVGEQAARRTLMNLDLRAVNEDGTFSDGGIIKVSPSHYCSCKKGEYVDDFLSMVAERIRVETNTRLACSAPTTSSSELHSHHIWTWLRTQGFDLEFKRDANTMTKLVKGKEPKTGLNFEWYENIPDTTQGNELLCRKLSDTLGRPMEEIRTEILRLAKAPKLHQIISDLNEFGLVNTHDAWKTERIVHALEILKDVESGGPHQARYLEPGLDRLFWLLLGPKAVNPCDYNTTELYKVAEKAILDEQTWQDIRDRLRAARDVERGVRSFDDLIQAVTNHPDVFQGRLIHVVTVLPDPEERSRLRAALLAMGGVCLANAPERMVARFARCVCVTVVDDPKALDRLAFKANILIAELAGLPCDRDTRQPLALDTTSPMSRIFPPSLADDFWGFSSSPDRPLQ